MFKAVAENVYEKLISNESDQKEIRTATLDDLVAAQNRTTRAVRSLAITLVAAPIIAFMVAIGIYLAVNSGNTAALVIMGVIAVAFSLGTLVSALSELIESKIPD